MSRYITRQRKAMLSYLRTRPDELLSAQEIAEALREQSISLSAVYRNLSDLEAEGQVRRSSKGGDREIRYQFMAAENCRGCLHLSCTKCGRTFHMHTKEASALVDAVERTENFTVDRSETVLYGLCGECRKP